MCGLICEPRPSVKRPPESAWQSLACERDGHRVAREGDGDRGPDLDPARCARRRPRSRGTGRSASRTPTSRRSRPPRPGRRPCRPRRSMARTDLRRPSLLSLPLSRPANRGQPYPRPAGRACWRMRARATSVGPVKRIVAIVVAAIALLAASPAAATRTFTYRAQFDGVGKSSILFDAKGTDKGTDFFSIRHISIWHIPFDCGAQAPTHGVFFLGGPVPVGYNLFDFDGSSDTLSIAFKGASTRRAASPPATSRPATRVPAAPPTAPCTGRASA